MNQLHHKTCPLCGSLEWNVFFKMLDVPVYCNVLWSTKQAAQECSKGDIKLAFCQTCGFIGNVAFDANRLEYTQSYENALDFSPRFQNYAQSLATRLVEEYQLYNKKIIEIGCGKGEFLIALCDLSNSQGVGFDPTYVALPEHSRMGGRVQFIQDFYSDQYADYDADFVCCRHTLEHVANPSSLLKTTREAIGDRLQTAVFFEVPNGLDTFRNMAIWDIIYEHCCYFTPVSLSYAFLSCGFNVLKLSDEYHGQFLCLEATPSQVTLNLTDQQMDEVKQLGRDIANFATNFEQKVSLWQEKLNQVAAKGQRAVVWGGGSKGIMFLNLLKGAYPIEYVVDINPRKQGMYATGTGQKIVAPKFLKEYRPEIVFVMNTVYKDEIGQQLNSLGLSAELICV